MSKYKVKQAFSYTDEKAPNPPQEVSCEAGAEIELDDEKATAIGASYLEKVVEGSSEQPPQPPAGEGEGGSESHTDTPPAPPAGGEGEGGDKGQE